MELVEWPAARVVEQLARAGVRAAPPVTDWRPADAPACPVADRAYVHVLSLPLYPSLAIDEQDRVIQALREVCENPAD